MILITIFLNGWKKAERENVERENVEREKYRKIRI
jgi:hypothetical protein